MSASFREQMKPILEKSRQRILAGFAVSTAELHRSITLGSELTGAPGQPVQTSNLLNSWVPEFLSPTEWQDTTNCEYARPIEDGEGPRGPLTLRSAVGGFHSVELTQDGLPNILEHARKQAIEQVP